MLKSKAINPLNFGAHGESTHNPDTSHHLEASYSYYGAAGTRSKSISSLKIPIKAYPSSISSIKKSINIIPNTDRGSISIGDQATKLDSPRLVQKNTITTNWEKMNKKAESSSPQKMQGNKSENQKTFLRPVDISKSQVRGNEVIVATSSKPNGNSHEINSAYLPIKALNNYTLKPITLNKDITASQKISNVYELPPFRSRKGQFIMQNSSTNHSFVKKNTYKEQGRGIPEFNIKNSTRIEHRENTHGSEERTPPKISQNELKLPKLDSANLPKHRSDGNLASSINSFNVNVPINTLDMVHKRQSTEAPIATERPPRNKIKSLDKNDLSKNKTVKTTLEEPRNPTIISMRKSSPEPTQDTSIRSKEYLQRELSPLPSRNLSISNIKNSQTISSIRELQDKMIVTDFAVKTQAGFLPGKGTKTNQDSYITHTGFAGHKDKYLFAVCDGHGQNGHLVSNFIKQRLTKNLETQYKTLRDENPASMKEMLTKTFLKTNRELSNTSTDINFSGTTTVSLLISNSKIWCANIGDSRAVLAKCINSEWTAHPLSRDHKPDEPSEMERILASGGRVDSFKDAYGEPLGPNRVWLKDEDLPGLAMSRSFGDGVAALAGVIAEPEITQFEMEKDDKFIVIASDGVWEFLSNKQVIDFVVPFWMRNELEPACDKLIREATASWKQDGEIIDDITCIIINLKPSSNK